jgi:hypothetical protein
MVTKQTSSQTIKQILELCEAFNMPAQVVSLVKSKCWKLVRNGEENENGIENYK